MGPENLVVTPHRTMRDQPSPTPFFGGQEKPDTRGRTPLGPTSPRHSELTQTQTTYDQTVVKGPRSTRPAQRPGPPPSIEDFAGGSQKREPDSSSRTKGGKGEGKHFCLPNS